MALIQGCSEQAVSKNIEKLKKEGKSQEGEALAIALDVARRNIEKCGRGRRRELRM